ncbi:hypothetical protein Hanom_Chr16g01509921 [Helianthus anomalus]
MRNRGFEEDCNSGRIAHINNISPFCLVCAVAFFSMIMDDLELINLVLQIAILYRDLGLKTGVTIRIKHEIIDLLTT